MDFSKFLTEEQKENIRKRKESEARRTVGKIIATDTAGNIFEKTAILSENLKILSFGGWIEYYLESTYSFMLERMKEVELEYFIIDIGGRNHKGYQVSIPFGEMLEMFRRGIELKERLENEPKTR